VSVEHIITRYSVQGDAQTIASLNKIAAAGQRAHASTHGGIIKAPPVVGGGSGGGIGDGNGGFGAGVMGQLGALGGSAAASVAVGGAAAIGLLAVAAKAAAQSVWHLASTYGAAENRLRTSIRALEGSDAPDVMKKLNLLAAKPGITPDEATTGYVQFRNAGLGRDLAMNLLGEIGNMNALSGGGAERFGRAQMAFGQIAMKGKLQQEEMLQLSEAGIPMGKVLKAGFGTTDTEAIQKMGLSAEETMQRLVAGMATLPRVGDSAANKLENLGVAIEKGLGAVGNGILESLAPSLERFGNTVMAMINSGELDALGKSIGDTWGALLDSFGNGRLQDLIYGVAGGIKLMAGVAEGFINLINASPIWKMLKALGKNGRADAEAGKAMDRDTLDALNKKALSPAQYAKWLERHPKGSELYARPPKPDSLGEGVLDGSAPPSDALKTAAQLMDAKATASRAGLGRGGASLSDIMTGGGDLGRLGVTAVELGGGGGGTKPAIVVQGGRELNEGVRMIVMSVIDQMQQGGQLAKA